MALAKIGRIGAAGLLGCLAACTPVRPQLTLEPGASLKGYEVFVVAPVINETGEHFNVDVTDSLREHLAERLRSNGFVVMLDPAQDTIHPAIVVTAALVGFRGLPFMVQVPTPGAPACELHALLTDRRSGQRIGRVAAAVLEEHWAPLTILTACAHDVGDAIARATKRAEKE